MCRHFGRTCSVSLRQVGGYCRRSFRYAEPDSCYVISHQKLTSGIQYLPAFADDNKDDEFGLSEFNFTEPDGEEESCPEVVYREYIAVKELLKHTRTCKIREKHEPAWNEEVHRPVLGLALDTQFEHTLAAENM